MSRLKEPTPRLTLCLAMDLMGSTTSGLKLSTKRLDRFNLALVDQLGPYLELVQLQNALVKFTGDGWLVVSDEQEDAAKLCCLAMIMANRFQWDIMAATGMPRDSIPALRLAVCWGRDLAVNLPNGHRDFVGNSVRHAVRACQLCEDNEVLVDETVRSWIKHDFFCRPCEFADRMDGRPGVKMEEALVLHVLENINPESAEDPEAPIYFVNTLAMLGQSNEADQLAGLISGRLAFEAASRTLSDEAIRTRWKALLSSNLDHDTARKIFADLKRSGLKPDLSSFRTLLEKAESFASEIGWLEELQGEHLEPDTEILNICLVKARGPAEARSFVDSLTLRGASPDGYTLRLLIQKAPDYGSASGWVDRLARLGVYPDAEAHELLIERAPDFLTARKWLEAMMDHDWEPSEKAFINTFSKGTLDLSGEELLRWYLGLRYHPAHPIKRAIAEYRKAGRVGDALRLALDYPHTDTALKAIRQHPEQALRYFRKVVDDYPDHPNGSYALGMALMEVGKPEDAAPWLDRAYKLAAPGPRKDELARYLALYGREVRDT